MLQQPVIVEAVRTPIGRIRGGLSSLRPDDLLALVLRAVVSRQRVDPGCIDEVFAGCANQAGEDNRNVARMATLLADFPAHIPAITVNRLCASGLDAVVQASRAIRVGDADWTIAGGVESMTRAPYVMAKPQSAFQNGSPEVFDSSLGWRFPNPTLAERFPLESMGETAENVAVRFGVSREDQDRFALHSHRKAVAAQDAGRFDAEIVTVNVPRQRREPARTITQDEGPRRDTDFETLQRLGPAFRQGGTVTAGNASTLNDGAAAVLLASEKAAKATGFRCLARVLSCASSGIDPRLMGMGPVQASKMALHRAGLHVGELDLVELNEAFAAQSLAVIRALEIDPERTNVNGGAIALGHPLGCSGTRILTTLVHELQRRQGRYGLATLCVGVGQGCAVVIERC